VASGAQLGEIRHILGKANLLDCFSTIVAMEDVRRGKPDPEPFSLAFRRLRERLTGLSPEECAAVEDSLGGIQSAHAAGISCLGVAHSYPRSRLEAANPKWVIDSISGFSEWLNRV
jgi:beta-phosphoglucomutase-like phosphatase (HAD superfamily)